MNEVIQCIDGALSKISPSKNNLEKMKEISDLKELVQSKESKIVHLQDIICAHEDRKELDIEKARLKESELLELQQQLHHLQEQVTTTNTLLRKANSTVKSLTDENVQLKADVTSLNKIENTLKSKNDVIKILESEPQTPPVYQDHKDMMQPLLAQQLRKGDGW